MTLLDNVLFVEIWYLSEKGNDTMYCGLSEEHPCYSLTWILTRYKAQNTSTDGYKMDIQTDKSLEVDQKIMVS